MRQYTNSEGRAFKRCRRKWYLSQVRRLQRIREDVTSAAAIGNRLHVGMEVLYDTGSLNGALNYVRGMAQADCEMYPEEAAQVEKDLELVERMIEGYVEWSEENGEDEDYDVLAIETKVEVPHPERDVLLLGKLDQRVFKRSTGEHMFRDWKSVQDFSRVKLLIMDEQLLHYMLLLRLAVVQGLLAVEDDELPRGGIYAMLRKVKRTARSKPPFYKMEIIRHNDVALRGYYARLTSLIDDIQEVERRLEAGEDHRAVAYPNPTRDCSWDCPYVAICPLFDDGSDVEAAIRIGYEERDPLARYGGNADEEAML